MACCRNTNERVEPLSLGSVCVALLSFKRVSIVVAQTAFLDRQQQAVSSNAAAQQPFPTTSNKTNEEECRRKKKLCQ